MLHPGCDPALNTAILHHGAYNHMTQPQLGPATPAPIVASSHQRHLQASASDPCAQIAHVLQCYQQGGEDADFVRKAIESLVKKLKDKRPELDSLIEAVTTSGKQPTGCVTIQRSLDGRLQVAGRKGVPTVVYARIWRWPNVNKNELQKLPLCRVSPDNQDLICVNPYHYERVVSSGISNIDLSSLRIDSSASGSGHQPSSASASVALSPLQQQLPPSCAVKAEQEQHQWMSSCSVAPNHVSGDMYAQGFAMAQPGPVSSNDGIIHPLIMQQQQQQQQQLQRIFDLNSVQVPPSPVGPPEQWCSISYYELDTQIGETFKVRRGQSEVFIDGGMDPAGARNGRFCLGALPNVHRSEASEKARLHIGKGVRLVLVGDGDVYMECLSNKAIFVRSYFLDFDNNRSYGSTVHKFIRGAEMRKIFDLRWCYAEMKRQSQSAQMAVVAQAAAVAGLVQPLPSSGLLSEHAGTGVDDLRRVCCTIGISFVKGWGSGYNRSAIKETPCWIEVQLHRALQLLDQVLHTMPGNSG